MVRLGMLVTMVVVKLGGVLGILRGLISFSGVWLLVVLVLLRFSAAAAARFGRFTFSGDVLDDDGVFMIPIYNSKKRR